MKLIDEILGWLVSDEGDWVRCDSNPRLHLRCVDCRNPMTEEGRP